MEFATVNGYRQAAILTPMAPIFYTTIQLVFWDAAFVSMSSKTYDLVLRDSEGGQWLQFREPRRILQTSELQEVMPLLEEVAARAQVDGLYAAGFVSYEAAAGFDSALVANDAGSFPLIWFGLYPEPEVMQIGREDAGEDSEILDWRPSISPATYRAAIRYIKEHIAAGRTYQVNYSMRLKARFDGDPWAYFLQLVRAHEPPYGAYADTGRYAICCASPELFFRLEGSQLSARPMKGTAPRGLTWTDDRAQGEWLHNSEKNRAENVMIVDMIRNDMGRVAQFGSVAVPQLFTVEKYPTLWQMTSTVTARTQQPLPVVMQALFPCASITGAPKRSTMQIIADLEPEPRRIYTGSIGYLAPDGKAQFNVAIRTVLVDRQRKRAEYGVGGGVIWDSTEDGEWEECATKARILTAKQPAFRLLETMLWTQEEGYLLLSKHLERLARSADYFDYAVDIDDICESLQEAARGFTAEAYRLRLLVARDGSVTLQTAPTTPETETQRVCLAPRPVDSGDPFLYHKTTNRGVYDAMRAACPGFDDVILWNERGEITESCLANVVVELDGERVTPPVSSGLLSGTYRAWLLERGTVRERVVMREELARCTGLWLVNSVRGEMAAVLEDREAEAATSIL